VIVEKLKTFINLGLGVRSMAEHLRSMYKALGPIPSTIREVKGRRNITELIRVKGLTVFPLNDFLVANL
jgi:hypothetical protein